MIGPSHVLYELKLQFWDLDATFTSDETERLGKKVLVARTMIAETIAELNREDKASAGKALGHYQTAIEDIDHTLAGSYIDSPGLEHAGEMVMKNYDTLLSLQGTAQGVQGLQNALENSKKLEEKFNLKIQQHVVSQKSSSGSTSGRNGGSSRGGNSGNNDGQGDNGGSNPGGNGQGSNSQGQNER